MAVSSIRPEELAFKWLDPHEADLNLWLVRAVNQGEIHTPKYHRGDRPIRLTEADVQRLLALKERMKAQDDDWMFLNRIKNGKTMKLGPIWYEIILDRRVKPGREAPRPAAHHLASSSALGSDQHDSGKDDSSVSGTRGPTF
jgi:hypothetical protein